MNANWQGRRAAYQRRNADSDAYFRRLQFAPPALRAGTSQRDVPTFPIRVHSRSFAVSERLVQKPSRLGHRDLVDVGQVLAVGLEPDDIARAAVERDVDHFGGPVRPAA